MTEPKLPIKKSVSLAWRGRSITFDVAQELFSSHQVDRGSRMLLDSLEVDAFGATGHAADFGCGYGVLGIAWQAVRPAWSMTYVDRDELAVAFTGHNLDKLAEGTYGPVRLVCDISLPYKEGGYDLVLWNVPGKAGREVIAGLIDVAIDALVAGGVLAVVVVHPLSDLFTDAFERDDATVTLTQKGKEHTVVHIRRDRGEPVERHPFESGLFDRPAQTFSVGELTWELTPVIGLPEYDSLSHATELAARALIALQQEVRVERWVVFDPGVGHLAMVASELWPDASGRVYGRDALEIRATRRGIEAEERVDADIVWGLGELAPDASADLAVVALPEQAQAGELAEVLGSVGGLLEVGGSAVFHGRSTEIARLERLIRREPWWRARRPEKMRGAACVTARHGAP